MNRKQDKEKNTILYRKKKRKNNGNGFNQNLSKYIFLNAQERWKYTYSRLRSLKVKYLETIDYNQISAWLKGKSAQQINLQNQPAHKKHNEKEKKK